jgi:hypothetical protein
MIQGFSGGLLNRELIYQTDLPSFQRDFASLKTLDHGTGPSITFTRASDATYFDADGVLQTASNNVARFDHDPATGASRGLLIEEARTNSIRNSQGGGSTNGVIGSGGVMPTNWGIAANANGVTSEIIGTGTEDGLAYIDIKVSGTPTASSSVLITFESLTQVVAANAQTWSLSAYQQLHAGSTANASVYINLRSGTSDGTFVSGQTLSTISAPTNSSLQSQRTSVTFTISDATVARITPRFGVDYTSGNPIDLTLRIAAPQLELGAFATSYIPTTTAAATRSADSAVVNPISSFYNASEGTLFAEGSSSNKPNALNALVSIDDTTADERIQIRRGTQFNVLNIVTATGGSPQASLDTSNGTWASPTEFKKIAYALKQNDLAVSMGGAAALTDTSATLPTVTRMVIGFGPNSQYVNGHIRKIAYWPKRLTNTLLEQLTT